MGLPVRSSIVLFRRRGADVQKLTSVKMHSAAWVHRVDRILGDMLILLFTTFHYETGTAQRDVSPK